MAYQNRQNRGGGSGYGQQNGQGYKPRQNNYQQNNGGGNGQKVDWKALRIGGFYFGKNNCLTGRITIEGVDYKVVCFENTLKKDGENTPDYYAHLSPDDDQGQQQQAPAPRNRPTNNGGRGPSRRSPVRNQPPIQQEEEQYQDTQDGPDQSATF